MSGATATSAACCQPFRHGVITLLRRWRSAPSLQVDPKDVTRRKAEATRTKNQEAKMAKASAGSKKISNFFAAPPKKS